MIGGGGDEVSVIPVVCPSGTVSVSPLSSFLSVGSSFKPSHTSLPLYLRVHHIQEYFNKNRGKNQKYTSLQEDKARHEYQRKQMRVTVRAKLGVGYW